MKTIILSFFILVGVIAYADSSSEEKIKQLEARIKALEAQQNVQKTNGLKVQDMQGQQMKNEIGTRSVSSDSPSMTEEQKNEIMQTIENYKKRQAESQKLLDELMNEP